MEQLIGISQFGAVRIQMIGIDHRHQRSRYGSDLLEAITGLARKLSREAERTDRERSVSMRLDLLDPNR